MGFWDALTGKSASKTMSRSTDALNRSLENQIGTINSAFDPGLEALGVGTRDAMNTAKGYNGEAQNYLGQGLNMARNDVRTNADQALRYLYGAMQGMQPYAQSGAAASGMYSNALGLNGADGKAAALGAFRDYNPGYQYSVDQATDQAARKAASLGMAASGNTLAAISDRAGHMADQNYGSWMDRLNGQQGLGMQAQQQIGQYAGQQAGIAQQAGATLGSLASNWGQNAASLQSNLGSQIGGWQNQLGRDTNASWMQRGTTLGALQAQNANTIANNYQMGAQATAAGAQNMFGLGLGALNTGLKAFGVGGF